MRDETGNDLRIGCVVWFMVDSSLLLHPSSLIPHPWLRCQRSGAGDRLAHARFGGIQGSDQGGPDTFGTGESRQALAPARAHGLITAPILAGDFVAVAKLVVERPPVEALPGRGQTVLGVVRPGSWFRVAAYGEADVVIQIVGHPRVRRCHARPAGSQEVLQR